ncbi:MAG: glycosyltransferase [Planctomycetes bacterium]|nr:glycosyltransferase [Planctomycetota bacterium]
MPGTLLFFAHDFPPLQTGGTLRSLKFVKYLPGSGWAPVVVTVDDDPIHRKDHKLLGELGPETEIVRVGARRFDRVIMQAAKLGLRNIATRLSKRWAFPDRARGWIKPAIRKGVEIARKRKVDILFATGSPWSSFLIVHEISQITGIPYVIDFRDPWTRNSVNKYDRGKLLEKAKSLEAKMIDGAFRVTTWGEVDYPKFLELGSDASADRIRPISNGYDESDFQSVPLKTFSKPTIVFSGSMYAFTLPTYVLMAVRKLVDSHEGDLPFQMIFVGNAQPVVAETVSELSLEKHVSIIPPVSHEDAISYLLSADALLVIIQEAENSTTAGKMYEYLRSGKPILGTVREGIAADLIRESGSGIVCAPADVEAISRGLLDILKFEVSDSEERSKFVQEFERRKLTAKLAAVFDEVRPAPKT